MTGTRVLVTGAARGYGELLSHRLAAAGCLVGVLGRDADRVAATAAAVSGVPLVADVLDEDAVASAVDAFAVEQGGLDVLVNNAGVGGPLGPAWEVPADEWFRCVEVNVRGTHHATRAAIPHLRATKGTVINVVSHAGVWRWPMGSAYAVSKAAVIKYGENLATELRREGVTVLNYHPGIMQLGLTTTLFEAQPDPASAPGRVADWFRSEIAAGHDMDPQLSADRLVDLVVRPVPHLSGAYLTAYQEPSEIRALEAPPVLGLLSP
jgi:NAD(P)-dependent dehydrogenase (short-subunit alcohol dehydrogenase family)